MIIWHLSIHLQTVLKYPSPASVSMMPCVERLNRLKPSASFRSFICLLTTDGVVRKSAAAFVKLRRSATRTKSVELVQISQRRRQRHISRAPIAILRRLAVWETTIVLRNGYQIPGVLRNMTFEPAEETRRLVRHYLRGRTWSRNITMTTSSVGRAASALRSF